MTERADAPAAAAAGLFAGPGEMAARCRAFDWAATPLGPVAGWPEALRTVVRTCLESPFPVNLWCGDALVLVYNDAYRRVLGAKHPAALGRPGLEVWAEIRADLEPMFAGLRAGGPPVYAEDAHFVMARGRAAGGAEVGAEGGADGGQDAWFTFGLSPVRDAAGDVVAFFNPATETTARVLAEQRLAALNAALGGERARLADAFQRAASFMVIYRGPRHVSEFVNEAYYGLIGHRPVLGRPLDEAVPEAREQGFLGLLDQVLATGEPVQFREAPVWLERTAGAPREQRYVDMVFEPLAEADGARSGVLAHGVDVTAHVLARREVERLLAESEAVRAAADLERRRLSTLLDHLPVGVTLAEAPGGRLVESNAAVRRIWGLDTPSAGIADYSADYVGYHTDPVQEVGRRYASDEWPLARALLRGETVTDEVIEIARPDGARRLVSVSAAPVRDAGGQVVGGTVVSLDVTERERLRAEREVALAAERAAAARLGLLQELAAAFSAALTPEAVVRVLLEHGVAALGATTGLVLLLGADGTHLTSAGAHGYPPGFAARFERVALDAGLPVAAAVREGRPVWVRDPDAARVYAELAPVYAATGSRATAALPLADAEGRVFGALAFNYPAPRAFDAEGRALKEAVARQCAQALERARLFAAERAARAEAEAANQAKAAFLATMSHELRTPLNAIGGYAELIELGIRGPVTPEQRADLEKIQRSQRHLLGLINGVLNYARVEAGAVHYDLEDVVLAQVLATCEALTAPQVRAKGLTLAYDACDRTLRARADREKVQQVVLNLLSNAVKFTGRGGRVALRCAGDGPVVRVAVGDTGIGIMPDQLDRVFEPFVQVDATLTRTQEGTGLGLAISRDLARGMGGDLTAESAPGVGSTFTLTLPAA